jgi:hypothetical protein
MSVLACPSCGETYVSTAQVCADCGVPLTESGDVAPAVHLDPSDDEVGYDLDDWEPEQRGELVAALTAQGIAHRWEDGELIVRERDADWVEPAIDEIDHPDALEVEDDDDDAAAELLSSLYVAADVLAGDHANPGAVLDLCAAEAEAQEMDAPYGVARDTWVEIQRRASVLAALLDDDTDEDATRHAARELRDLLHPLV